MESAANRTANRIQASANNSANNSAHDSANDLASNSANSQQNSPPQKRVKIQIDQNHTPETHPSRDEQPSNEPLQQQTSNSKEDGIYNFCLPSKAETKQTPEENLEPNSAGLKSSRTGGVWHKSLEESYSAQIKERSLLGHLQCSGEIQKQILESDIFRILSSEGVTGIGALYKVSPSKFVLVFGSQTEKEKLKNTVIQSRFGESDIYLNFSKRGGLLRDGKEPILVTINLPE